MSSQSSLWMSKPIELVELVCAVANILKVFDSERPIHKSYKPGIGPFGEPQLVKEIARRLTNKGISARTTQTPADMDVGDTWAIEFKIVRPYGDNDIKAENWSQNLLHPYDDSTSLIGDAIKLLRLDTYPKKSVFAIGYEHETARIDLEPLISSFELISRSTMNIPLGQRIEERRTGLVHPTHQVVRCVAWQLDE